MKKYIREPINFLTHGIPALLAIPATILLINEANGAIQKLPFSTESRSTLGATITARDFLSGFSKSGTAGYTLGGNQRNGGYMSPNTVNIIDKIAYSNDTVSSAGSLINAAFLASGFANSGVL